MPTGGVVPLGVQSRRKCPPSAEKSLLELQAELQAAFGTDGDIPVSLTCLATSSGPQGPRRARAIDKSRVGREGGCVRGGWVVSGVGCRGRHFAASRNASSFLVLIGFGAREVSILERLSAAHCDEGRVVTTETNERLYLWQLWQR